MRCELDLQHRFTTSPVRFYNPSIRLSRPGVTTTTFNSLTPSVTRKSTPQNITYHRIPRAYADYFCPAAVFLTQLIHDSSKYS